MEATSVYYIWLYDLEDILRRNRFLFFFKMGVYWDQIKHFYIRLCERPRELQKRQNCLKRGYRKSGKKIQEKSEKK